LHVIVAEGLYDRAFVTDSTVGFADLRDRVREYAPARVAEITGVPEADIVAAARLYATTAPAVITWGFGVDKIGPNAQAAAHARAILRAVTGNLDVTGGESFGRAPALAGAVTDLEMENPGALAAEQRAKQIGAAQHPLMAYAGWEATAAAVARLPRDYVLPPPPSETIVAPPREVFAAMLTGRPYPVKALICQAANPLLTLADPRRTAAALAALDLLVVMDYYRTPTAQLADFVLPAACTVERDDLTVGDSACVAFPRALDPLAERRSDYELWMELGRRLDQGEHWPWDTVAQVCDHRLAPLGLTFADLVARRAVTAEVPVGRSRTLGFGTPSGKVEIRSSILGALRCGALPRHVPVPRPDAAFPLVLITGSNFAPMYHSEQRQWPTARAQHPEPRLAIHPATAAEHGIAAGDWVCIRTRHGAIRQRAHLDDRLRPDTVDAEHGWWFPERTDDPLRGVFESNANVLCSDAPEESALATGGWMLSGLCCRVERVDTVAETPPPDGVRSS
jgi:anaerobic selenocysteine-containing dehydrogenase